MNTPKNTKRALAAFINLAAVVSNDILVAFLVSHGYAAVWSLANAEKVARTIGADVARAELEYARSVRAGEIARDRAAKLAAARAAWVAGDPHAFDGIYW